MDIVLDVLTDAFLDTLYLVPFLFVTYLFMEWLEHKTSAKAQEAVKRAGVGGPVVGSLLGVVPQCGFSAAAATLYAARVISIGTLFAVFLSTSDEMLPIFIAEQVSPSILFTVIGLKIVIAIVFGFAIDAFMRATNRQHEHLRIHELCERDQCECSHGCETCEHNPELVYEHHDCDLSCQHDHHHHDHSHDSGWGGIARSAVKHTIQVTIFVFLVSLVLNAVLVVVGEDALGDFLSANALLAVVGSAIVGLIPNCAASVAIAQLYIEGALSFGAMMAGLLSAAGVGMLVLLRTNRHAGENMRIILALVVISVLCGFVIELTGFTL
ncbi:MAG: arsenic efflux protein [Eggerthellaceae bacterium]|nr:arsenic efflux protein [Eggerthellaceae bacterium]